MMTVVSQNLQRFLNSICIVFIKLTFSFLVIRNNNLCTKNELTLDRGVVSILCLLVILIVS